LAQVVQQELQVAAEQMAGNQFLVAQRLLVEIVELVSRVAQAERRYQVQVQVRQVLQVQVEKEVLVLALPALRVVPAV
jgi:hypothetical protein